MELLETVGRLPEDWHGAGSFHSDVLRAFARYGLDRELTYTAETGTGKSTLLFSHLSRDHKVFTYDDTGYTDSLRRVTESPLLNHKQVEFIVGPTQQTLPRYTFTRPLDLVLLDGPHAYPFPEMEYYHFYPHLAENAILIVDDIHIPTIFRLFEFLREDEMFDTIEVIHTTAFFRRNSASMFDPLRDGWWLQGYNTARFPLRYPPAPSTWSGALRRHIPEPLKRIVRWTRRLRHRAARDDSRR